MHWLGAASFFVLLASPAAAALGYGRADAPRDIEPLQLGQIFCESRISGDMTALRRFFAPKLVRLIDEAEAAGLQDSVQWQSRDDQPTGCTIEIVNGFDNTIGVLVRISYEAPGARWSDVINLERTPDSWLINNIFYDGGGNLRFRLFEALD